MKKVNLLKFLLPLLFALAIALGLIQHAHNPYAFLGSSKTTLKRQSSGDKSLSDYYSEAAQNLPIQASSTASFLAVGDINLSRNVAGAMQKALDSYLPYRKMENILKSTNFNFGNFESPYSPTCKPIVGGHAMIFAASCQSGEGFLAYNFKILNLANNHAMDQGADGLFTTKKYLEGQGIKTIGTGENLGQAWQPAVVKANGIKICFIGASYASVNDSGKTVNNYVTRIDDLQNLKSSILNLKSSCDFIVATMHAGTEYTRQPNQDQINFAHAAIDDGADMVIGNHPHWVQTIEKYQNKYIFYSLGNFIFDQMWSQDTREGLALKITVSKPGSCSLPIYGPNKTADKSANYNCPDLQGQRTPATLDSIELIPVIIENYSTPRPANADEAKKILNKINIKSAALLTP